MAPRLQLGCIRVGHREREGGRKEKKQNKTHWFHKAPAEEEQFSSGCTGDAELIKCLHVSQTKKE